MSGIDCTKMAEMYVKHQDRLSTTINEEKIYNYSENYQDKWHSYGNGTCYIYEKPQFMS